MTGCRQQSAKEADAQVANGVPIVEIMSGDPGSTTSDSDSRIIEIPFNDNTTYEFKGSGSFFTLTSVLVNFPDGAESNTVTITLIRGADQKLIQDYTYNGKTFIWYLPNNLFFKGGDKLKIDNTTVSDAIATLNLQF